MAACLDESRSCLCCLHIYLSILLQVADELNYSLDDNGFSGISFLSVFIWLEEEDGESRQKILREEGRERREKI